MIRPLWHALVTAAVLAITATSLTACSSPDTASSASTTGYSLRVGFISTTSKPAGPEGWAQANGSLAAGLKGVGVTSVRWLPFKNGPDLSAAMSGGSLDLAILGDTPGLTARAGGVDTRLVNQSAVGQDSWLYASKNGPASVADLRGKTVATQVGSYMYRYLVALLQQAGIYDTVKITHVYTANALAALTSGGVAAYAAPPGVLSDALTKAGFPLLDKASSDHKNLLGTSVTVITSKALAAHPDLPAAWNAVRTAAVGQLKADPGAYYAFASGVTKTPAATVAGSLPVSVYPDTPFTPTGLTLLSGTASFLFKNKLAKSVVDLDTWKVATR